MRKSLGVVAAMLAFILLFVSMAAGLVQPTVAMRGTPVVPGAHTQNLGMAGDRAIECVMPRLSRAPQSKPQNTHGLIWQSLAIVLAIFMLLQIAARRLCACAPKYLPAGSIRHLIAHPHQAPPYCA